MIRIMLPLAIFAALFFTPLFSETTSGSVTGDTVTSRSGQFFIGDTVNCWRQMEFSLSGDCEPAAGMQGLAVAAAAGFSVLAAALGVIGLLPFIGRLTSIVTVLAGAIAVGAMGYFILTMMGSSEGLGGVQWGAYLTGGVGLLTLISGLSGMRGR
ncbi:MAG: hypothetical protein AAFX54_16940 [Pseudomonadota bacterium]